MDYRWDSRKPVYSQDEVRSLGDQLSEAFFVAQESLRIETFGTENFYPESLHAMELDSVHEELKKRLSILCSSLGTVAAFYEDAEKLLNGQLCDTRRVERLALDMCSEDNKSFDPAEWLLQDLIVQKQITDGINFLRMLSDQLTDMLDLERGMPRKINRLGLYSDTLDLVERLFPSDHKLVKLLQRAIENG